MFNTIINKTTEYVPYTKNVEVHEHRAPTDKSVELLNEMQEKTLENIIKTIKVNDNTLNAIVVYRLATMAIDEIHFRVVFTFNGKKQVINGTISHADIDDSTYGSNAVLMALGKQLCYLFADSVLKSIDSFKDFRFSF